MKKREGFGEKLEKKRLSTRKFWKLIREIGDENIEFKIDFEEFFLKKISEKEKKILFLLFEGYLQKEIAYRLNLSQQAVSKRIKKIKNLVVFFCQKRLINREV